MNENISKFQEIKLLLAFIRHADEKGNVDFEKTNIGEDIGKIAWNGNWIDSLLYKLNEAGVIHYEEIGEDGFKPIIMAGVSSHTHEYLAGLIESVNEEHDALENRISEILTFNPKLLSKTISDTQAKLDEVAAHIGGNELLKPIEKPLKEIRHHFQSVSAVSSNYEDIYKNIIRPVQEEGRSGVKATVKWAVISIILSACISLAINNWNTISALLQGA
ncbi:MAG: hypothetical protein ACQEVQ_06510 [Pseudomonadota bacterium]|uniref:Uncharacterized protein n=1 Tax=Idiomarina seosinensis TaxID=281739 RepID=A0A432ZHV1_9GAMM|nr:hypothetical protein [Idiomarina seosinensis]RUO77464.1 hypothetical protein CWI81_03000 [Idiomarina seosinensis]